MYDSVIRLCNHIIVSIIVNIKFATPAKCVESQLRCSVAAYSDHDFLMSEENCCLCLMWAQCWLDIVCHFH